MSVDLYLAFVAATTVLMLIPGPNVALICANSIAHGARFGLLTVVGTSAAMALQLALTIAGMTALLAGLAGLFDVLRWAGVAYLLFLGVQAWRAAPVDLASIPPQARSLRTILTRGFLISLTNPKTLLFYGAFMPQFIAPQRPAGPQLLLMAATALVLAMTLDSLWALTAARFRGALAARAKLRNRLTGGLLISAALGLSLARKS